MVLLRRLPTLRGPLRPSPLPTVWLTHPCGAQASGRSAVVECCYFSGTFPHHARPRQTSLSAIWPLSMLDRMISPQIVHIFLRFLMCTFPSPPTCPCWAGSDHPIGRRVKSFSKALRQRRPLLPLASYVFFPPPATARSDSPPSHHHILRSLI